MPLSDVNVWGHATLLFCAGNCGEHGAWKEGYGTMNHDMKINEGDVVARWVDAAERGDAEAQFRLGMLCKKGSGEFPKSPSDALVWLTRSADQGHIQACCHLGILYKYGDGPRICNGEITEGDESCERNDELSNRYFAVAIKGLRALIAQNDTDAMLWLAALYTHGDGVEKNDAEAQRLLVRAAELGNPIAENRIGMKHC